MAKQPYFGPCGIFSTDNPVSDRMQIEAEQFDEAEWLGEEPLDDGWEEYYSQPTTIHSFECSVHGHEAYFDWEEFPEVELEEWTRQKQAEHDKVCNCGQPIKVK